MKKKLHIGLLTILPIFLILMMTGCNDSFLDRSPETSITEANFFESAEDLELYSNQFYSYFYFSCYTCATQQDSPSDNVVCSNTTDNLYNYMSNAINPNTVGKWDWSDIRNVNYMIAREDKATGDDVDHYKGLAHLTRALLYYNKVVSYSDVPWYSRDLQTDDDDLLYKTQDSRSVVCDSILNDLDYAISHMKTASEMGDHTYITKDVALALKARICNNEGAWRKYHSELGLDDYNRFYEEAVSACEELMGMGYSLSSDYSTLFRNSSLADNPEVILYIDYDKATSVLWGYQDTFSGGNGGLSNDLLNTYLYIEDGKAVPFTSISGSDTLNYNERFENRDPRLKMTFMYPGYFRPNGTGGEYYQQIISSVIGHHCIKWDPLFDNENVITYGPGDCCFGDVAKFRYAEVLLNYAEAKAELGTLTQDDLDISINLLRTRVGMPTATLSEWLSDIDPVLEAKYPNVTSSQKGAILEVRRERRVELVAEGFREADMFRWGLGEDFEDLGKGLYIGTTLPAYLDLDGDGTTEVAIIPESANEDDYLNQNGVSRVYVVTTDNFLVSSDGYLIPNIADGTYEFVSPKYYYTPISSQDILLNPNLKQNPNWE